MREYTHLELISPHPVLFQGVGHIISPTVRNVIRDTGQDEYNSKLSILLMTKVQLLESLAPIAQEKILKALDEQNAFTILMLVQPYRQALVGALNYFLQQKVEVSENGRCLQVFDQSQVRRHYNLETKEWQRLKPAIIGQITEQNFDDLRKAVLQRNYITPPDESKAKRRSKKMIQFDKKIEQGRKKSKRYKQERKAMQLGNLVSKISKYTNLNITNAFDLTVYQLYDQFFEVSTQIQLDAATMRWCIWGKDKFDFSQWFKTINEK